MSWSSDPLTLIPQRLPGWGGGSGTATPTYVQGWRVDESTVRLKAKPSPLGAMAEMHVPSVIVEGGFVVDIPVMGADAELNAPAASKDVVVHIPVMEASAESGERLPYELPFPLGGRGGGMFPPNINEDPLVAADPMPAVCDMHVPIITSDTVAHIPVMEAVAEAMEAAPGLGGTVDVDGLIGATGEMHAPTVSLGVTADIPPMTADGDMTPPTVANGVVVTGEPFEATSELFAPTVESDATVTVPEMGAAVEMYAPVADVSESPPVEASEMLANAELYSPAVTAGATVSVPVMGADADMDAPTAELGITVQVPAPMGADAESSGLPYELPFPLGGGAGMQKPEVIVWTDTASPEPFEASATMHAPVVTLSVSATAPLMTANASLPAHVPAAGANVTAPVMTATGIPLFDVNKAPLPMSPASQTFTTAGAYTYNIPSDAVFIDIVLLGGGASGQTGNGANSQRGDGGNAGTWQVITLQRGVDIPWNVTQITGTVGAGGAQAPNSDHAGPNAGGASTAVVSGYGTITAAGGTGKTSGQNGASPGNRTHNGVTYTGGSGGTGNGGAGTAPGGAGAGGNGGIFGIRTRGGAGGAGRVWFRAYN